MGCDWLWWWAVIGWREMKKSRWIRFRKIRLGSDVEKFVIGEYV